MTPVSLRDGQSRVPDGPGGGIHVRRHFLGLLLPCRLARHQLMRNGPCLFLGFAADDMQTHREADLGFTAVFGRTCAQLPFELEWWGFLTTTGRPSVSAKRSLQPTARVELHARDATRLALDAHAHPRGEAFARCRNARGGVPAIGGRLDVVSTRQITAVRKILQERTIRETPGSRSTQFAPISMVGVR